MTEMMKHLCRAATSAARARGGVATSPADIEAVVRVVLTELREPTDAMIEEGNSVRTGIMASENTRATWDAMIAAALAEPYDDAPNDTVAFWQKVEQARKESLR